MLIFFRPLPFQFWKSHQLQKDRLDSPLNAHIFCNFWSYRRQVMIFLVDPGLPSFSHTRHPQVLLISFHLFNHTHSLFSLHLSINQTYKIHAHFRHLHHSHAPHSHSSLISFLLSLMIPHPTTYNSTLSFPPHISKKT